MTTSTATGRLILSRTQVSAARKGRWWRFRPVYLLLAAWLVGVLFPYVWMFITSITPPAEIPTLGKHVLPRHPSLEGYRELFGTSFVQYFFNSLLVAIGVVILTTTFALMAGTALSRFRFRGRTPVLFGILLVQLLPSMLLIVPLYIELKTFGLLNTRFGLIFIYTAFSLPFSTWLMKGFVDQIPVALEEASFIDGCTRFRSFMNVILPLARPGIAAAGTFAFIYSWNEFLFALTFTSTTAARTIPPGLELFIGSENGVHWEAVTAGGVIAAIPILIGFLFAQRMLVSGLTAGAVKG